MGTSGRFKSAVQWHSWWARWAPPRVPRSYSPPWRWWRDDGGPLPLPSSGTWTRSWDVWHPVSLRRWCEGSRACADLGVGRVLVALGARSFLRQGLVFVSFDSLRPHPHCVWACAPPSVTAADQGRVVARVAGSAAGQGRPRSRWLQARAQPLLRTAFMTEDEARFRAFERRVAAATKAASRRSRGQKDKVWWSLLGMSTPVAAGTETTKYSAGDGVAGMPDSSFAFRSDARAASATAAPAQHSSPCVERSHGVGLCRPAPLHTTEDGDGGGGGRRWRRAGHGDRRRTLQ
mmetsp:Transcript_17615/g.45098  ORF Transcript_17615/g.45098 Transcript_17615/m.45098 type:complete len:290 (+) Transcript_17615:17-886(+)